MPPLRFGADIFPTDLFDLNEAEVPWWVAHTRSRQDKALARHLIGLSIPFFLPQREKRYRHNGRTFVSYIPLFPGYVFFRGGETERHGALRSNLLVRTIPVLDQGQLTRELLQLRSQQMAGASLVPLAEFAPGDPVRVIDGPFKGYVGVVVREAGRLRLVVSVSMIKGSVAVEFERDVLSKPPAPIGVESRSLAAARS
jgi:hypothetical protein